MPLPRFTIRRMMIAVAICGLMFGAAVIKQRRSKFLKRAETCVQHEWALSRLATAHKRSAARRRSLYEVEALPADEASAQCSASAEYYARMKRKYELAARYPWLPIEPDPPEPKVDIDGNP